MTKHHDPDNEPLYTVRQADDNMFSGNTIVKVDNGANAFDYSSFTKIELNVFMALCAQLVEKEDERIHIPLAQLRSLSGITATAKEKVVSAVMNTYQKVTAMDIAYQDPDTGKKGIGHLFYNYEYDPQAETLEVMVNPKLTWVLNGLENKYTMYLLPDFVGIHNIYAKKLYMNLMQWRATTASLTLSLPQLQELLGYPKGYTSSRINERVITPIRKELKPLLDGFAIEAVKHSRKIIGFTFSFKPMPKLSGTTLTQEKRIGELNRLAAKKAGKIPLTPEELAAMPDIRKHPITDRL